MSAPIVDVSVVIVSFNTCDLLRECLQSLTQEVGKVTYEVIVVDNASRDNSVAMVKKEFPEVQVISSQVNLGFGVANNVAFAKARGRYIVLLNSDAFLKPGALEKAVTAMDANPKIGLGGARLVGRDDSWQPSARMFPSLLNHFLVMSGLADKYPRSSFFGRFDRTWADPKQSAVVDWVPGAFSIIRREVLEQVGYFDERFFLYFEEVDLCCRIRQAGYQIWYLAEVVVVHLGGESSKTLKQMTISKSGTQVSLWQMRSALLFYHKHRGKLYAWLWMQIGILWHGLRAWKNSRRHPNKSAYSRRTSELLKQAWRETQGGKLSPPRPW